MDQSAKEKLNSLEKRLLRQEKEFAEKRSALEQSLKSLTEILDRTGWNYPALASKAEELGATLERQREECARTEKKLNSVVSYINRIDKINASIEDLDKEYEVWKEFLRPSLESDIEVARGFLEEQAHLEGPSEKVGPEKLPEKVIAKYKEEEEVLARNLEQRKQEIESISQEIEQRKKELQGMENGLSRQREEAENNLLELKAKYKTEEEAMVRGLRKKEEELKVKLMAWAQAQKQKLEQKFKAQEEAAQRAMREGLKKEPPIPANEGKVPAAPHAPPPAPPRIPEQSAASPRKVATVTQLPIKPQPQPAIAPRENRDAQGTQRIFLADQNIEVKLKGIIEMGLLYDLTDSEMGILVKRGNEAMRPGNVLPGVMCHLPDSGAIGGRAEVKGIYPNTDERYDYKIILTVAAPDLPESQRAELAKFIEKSRLDNFKGRHLKVENDF